MGASSARVERFDRGRARQAADDLRRGPGLGRERPTLESERYGSGVKAEDPRGGPRGVFGLPAVDGQRACYGRVALAATTDSRLHRTEHRVSSATEPHRLSPAGRTAGAIRGLISQPRSHANRDKCPYSPGWRPGVSLLVERKAPRTSRAIKGSPTSLRNRSRPGPTADDSGRQAQIGCLGACAMMGSMDSREDEGELYRKIISRSKRVRERAAESLRRARALRKPQRDADVPADAGRKHRRFRHQD